MTSEATEDAARKRRLRRVAFLQRHKAKIRWLLSLAGIGVMVLGYAAPSHTVISCQDPTIRRHSDKDTISVAVLFFASLVLPFFVMTLVEWLAPPDTPAPSGVSSVWASIRRSWGHQSDLFVGGLFMYFVTDLLKTTVGEARPVFWEQCTPNLTAEQCAQEYVTVTWKDCTNPTKLSHWRLVESMKSFPSGHASISVYSSVFMIVYTHKRLWKRWSNLACPWIQMAWLSWGVVCGQSRIWDNKHFWWDVLAGSALGAAGALISVHFLANWFERQDQPLRCPKGKQDASPLPSSSSSYLPEEEEEDGEGDQSSRFSHTSIKRLIPGGEGEGGGGVSEREMGHISSAPP